MSLRSFLIPTITVLETNIVTSPHDQNSKIYSKVVGRSSD